MEKVSSGNHSRQKPGNKLSTYARSSAVIEEVKALYSSNPTVAIAYFYFDFNDTEKQRHDRFTRSLVEQLAWQSVNALAFLDSVVSRKQNANEQPKQEELELTLQQMLGDFEETFIIIDALDECEEREELILLLVKLKSWGGEKMHVLVTSRKERDIEEGLAPLLTREIRLQSALVDKDICNYISERLRNDTKLRKWPTNVREEIERALIDGAQGMYVNPFLVSMV